MAILSGRPRSLSCFISVAEDGAKDGDVIAGDVTSVGDAHWACGR